MANRKLENIPLDRDVYAFELDDVLYPKQDYLLQVYYLFGSFYEFTEGTVSANELAQLMKKVYLFHGEDKVFDTIKEVFAVQEKYRENFERLQANAQIPLRLELFEQACILLKELFDTHKNVVILTKGNPVEQLNKLKFFNWGELTPHIDKIKIYFVDELRHQHIDVIPYLAGEFNVAEDKILLVD